MNWSAKKYKRRYEYYWYEFWRALSVTICSSIVICYLFISFSAGNNLPHIFLFSLLPFLILMPALYAYLPTKSKIGLLSSVTKGINAFLTLVLFLSLVKGLSGSIIVWLKIDEKVQIITLVAGLLGAPLLAFLYKMVSSPDLEIYCWEDSELKIRNSKSGVSSYMLRVINHSQFFSAKSCEIKITMPELDREITSIKNNYPAFITGPEDIYEIKEENILWDIQPGGEKPLKVDIAPQSSYLSTLVESTSDGCFLIKSENNNKNRIVLDNNQKYEIKISLYGENIKPLFRTVILENQVGRGRS